MCFNFERRVKRTEALWGHNHRRDNLADEKSSRARQLRLARSIGIPQLIRLDQIVQDGDELELTQLGQMRQQHRCGYIADAFG